MRGLWSSRQRLQVAFLALAMLPVFFMASGAAIAEDTPGGPDTPVSSDGSAPATSVTAGTTADSGISGAAEPAQVSAGSDGSEVAQSSSQVKKKLPVSHDQEAKDRLFVDATFIAIALILCAIAFFLFMSLPKQPKKAGGDGQQEM